MRFMCLIAAERVMEQMPEEVSAEQYRQYTAFTRDIQRTGNFVGGNRLLPASTATTVRVRDGKTIVTDGPFAETREQVGGYYLIDADDLQQAIEIASRIPGAKYGCVEVRAIATDPQTQALGLDSLYTK